MRKPAGRVGFSEGQSPFPFEVFCATRPQDAHNSTATGLFYLRFRNAPG
jgi:hypothetical protein